jgi:hypothetical protein
VQWRWRLWWCWPGSHFETTAEDVLAMYRRVTGEELDMTISADTTDADY